LPVELGAPESVRRHRVDEGEGRDRSVLGVVRDGGAASGPADEVDRTLDAQLLDQGERVVSPVAEAARGVDGYALGVAETLMSGAIRRYPLGAPGIRCS